MKLGRTNSGRVVVQVQHPSITDNIAEAGPASVLVPVGRLPAYLPTGVSPTCVGMVCLSEALLELFCVPRSSSCGNLLTTTVPPILCFLPDSSAPTPTLPLGCCARSRCAASRV